MLRQAETFSDKELNIHLDPPKQGLPFMVYARQHRPKFKDQNPDASLVELSRMASAGWKALSAEEKRVEGHLLYFNKFHSIMRNCLLKIKNAIQKIWQNTMKKYVLLEKMP